MTATLEAKPSAPHDPNQGIIDEYRANDGKVGGHFQGFPLLLLHNKGARSGIERISPLACQAVDGDTWAVFASKGGADDNPGWYYNVLANPDTTIEVDTETIAVKAHEAKGHEYDRIWGAQTAKYPTFAAYARKSARAYIPVVVLQRA